MKHLNLIKLVTGLFRCFFGIKILNEIQSKESQGYFNLSYVWLGGQSAIAATYTPIYAGICNVSGAYLISNIKN